MRFKNVLFLTLIILLILLVLFQYTRSPTETFAFLSSALNIRIPKVSPSDMWTHEGCMGLPGDEAILEQAPFETRHWKAATLEAVRAQVRSLVAKGKQGPIYAAVGLAKDNTLDAWILLPNHTRDGKFLAPPIGPNQMGRSHAWMMRLLHHPIYVQSGDNCIQPCPGETSTSLQDAVNTPLVMRASIASASAYRTTSYIMPCGCFKDRCGAKGAMRANVDRLYALYRVKPSLVPGELRQCYLPENLPMQAYCHHQLISKNQRFALVVTAAGLMLYENTRNAPIVQRCKEGRMPEGARPVWTMGGAGRDQQVTLVGSTLSLVSDGVVRYRHTFPLTAGVQGPFTVELTDEGQLILLYGKGVQVAGGWAGPPPGALQHQSAEEAARAAAILKAAQEQAAKEARAAQEAKERAQSAAYAKAQANARDKSVVVPTWLEEQNGVCKRIATL